MSVTAVPLHPISKGSVAKLWVALAVLLALAVGLAWWGTSAHVWSTTGSGLKFRTLKAGKGPSPTATDVTLIQYTGRLQDGTVFDSNVGQQPAAMPAADGAAIKGFTEGLRMMHKGGTYRLKIPAPLAYGPQGRPPAIPPNAPLEFDVTLVDFIPMAELRAMQQQQMLLQQMQQQQQGAQSGRPGAPQPGGAPAE